MDWNWFFSSLSQSAAAIVGIFGAFIITKILSNQVAFSEKKNRLKEIITSGEKIAADAASLYFNWYNKHTSSKQFEELDELLEKGSEEDADTFYKKLDFSPFIEKDLVVRRIEACLVSRRERQRREQEEAVRQAKAAQERSSRFDLGSFRSLSGMPGMSMQSGLKMNANLGIFGELRKEREAIDLSIRESRHHMRRISDFRDSIIGNPESSLQITWALTLVAILFYVGVIYPLSFMPLPVNAKLDVSIGAFFDLLWSIRGLLLTAVALIFSAVLAMFFVMNVKMKYLPSELAQLERFSSIGAYSSFFSIMEENCAVRVKEKDRKGEATESAALG